MKNINSKIAMISEEEMEALAQEMAKEWLAKEKKEVEFIKSGVTDTLEKIHDYLKEESYMDLDDQDSFEIETLFSYLLLFASENEVTFTDEENWFPNQNAVFAYKDQHWLVFEMSGQGTHRSISLLKDEEKATTKGSTVEQAISWFMHRIELVELINSIVTENGSRIEITEEKKEEVKNKISSWSKEKGESEDSLQKDLDFFVSQI